MHDRSIFASFPDYHLLKQMADNYDKFIFTRTFIDGLCVALELLKKVDIRAYDDFINHKLLAKSKNGIDSHQLFSALCELAIINTFIRKSNHPESFKYEPCLRKDNNKNVEFSINILDITYNVEVKTPNFENFFTKLDSLMKNNNSVIWYETRLFELNQEQKKSNMTSTDYKVKEFLEDSNLKFPPSKGSKNSYNVLFICWNEHTDQPCANMKDPMCGLLTKNSWYKEKGNPIVFNNIDLIFVSDLLQNMKAHISSGNEPLPSFITGVPYFERNKRFLWPTNTLSPFILAHSRNVFIEQDRSIPPRAIYNLPIAFEDQNVIVVTEDFVSKNCATIKFSIKT